MKKHFLVILVLFGVAAQAKTIECQNGYVGHARVEITRGSNLNYKKVSVTLDRSFLAVKGLPGHEDAGTERTLELTGEGTCTWDAGDDLLNTCSLTPRANERIHLKVSTAQNTYESELSFARIHVGKRLEVGKKDAFTDLFLYKPGLQATAIRSIPLSDCTVVAE